MNYNRDLCRSLLLTVLLADTVPVIADDDPCPPTHTADNSDTAQTNNGDMGYLILPEQLKGRAYYRLDPDSTCKAHAPDRTVIKSWANKISFEDGRLLLWGKTCNDSPQTVPLSKAASEITISRDLTRIRYQGECLYYYEMPPKLCEFGSWCPAEDEAQGDNHGKQ